jgi:dTDP-glucose 4,6-dehydratase
MEGYGGNMKILITGGCGFAGHHVVEHFLKNTDMDIIIWDKLTYASSGLDRVRDINAFDDKRVSFFSVDFTRPISNGVLRESKDANYILHMGAETHVDNSITDPMSFVYANVVGTGNVLEFARKCDNLEAFVYFSTDEVYGPALMLDKEATFRGMGQGGYELDLYHAYREWDRYNATNPYSATKAGAEQLTLAFMNTYKIPGFIVNCMNLFGERQHPEKFIPLCINRILTGEKIYIHGTEDKLASGSRFYIHCRNMASAVHWLFDKFKQRDKYNIVGEKELENLELATIISDIIGKELNFEIVDFHSSRPGHDLRYGLDDTKLSSMGFKVPVTIEKSLEKTVKWTLENRKWLKKT